MSSLRNAVQRRNHRERAQPHEREQKWGLLEKHKDYALRAKSFNEKKKRLKILREKAANRNEDEFSFGMMSSRTQNGRKIADRGNKALSQDVVALLKAQDAGYLRTVLQQTRKERQKLEESIEFGGEEEEGLRTLKSKGGSNGRHMVFVDSTEEQKGFKPEAWFGTDQEGLQKSYNRPKKQSANLPEEEGDDVLEPSSEQQIRSRRAKEAELQAMKEERAARKRRQRDQEVRHTRLEALKARERDLMVAEEELANQRARMNNNIGGVNKNGVKFKVRERKR